MRICVIDSGCSPELAQNADCSIKQINCLDNVLSNWKVLEQCHDHLGHGTAVVSTIIKGIKKAEVIVLQIFDEDYEVDQEKLYDILQYVNSNICCDLLHMSFGVISCSNIAKLEDLCASIHHKGTIIVSAYNNEGAISYPAFFNCVIGVDSFHVQYGRKYTYIENSPINIQVNIGVKRITVDGVPHLFTGSSFSSAYISNIILTQLLRDPETNIYHYLKKTSSEVKKDTNIIPYPKENKKKGKRKRAIVFPLNKEIQTLLNFSDMLPFDIVGVYDGNHSKNVNGIYRVPTSLASKKEFRIGAYSSIDWQSE